jgi:type VI secretion system secreted protein VgrG
VSQGRLAAPVFEFRCKSGGARPWRVRQIDLHEELSGRCSATIDLDHDDQQAEPAALLSASATLALTRPGPGGSARTFCGIVRSVDEPHGRAWGDRRRCQVVLEPAFLCLDEEVLTRPFVGLSVPQILREVLGDALGRFAGRGFELRLQRPIDDPASVRSYAIRELCVQYGESTYDFCRRLMAEEGMTHFFDHTGEVEKLVVVDEAQFERAGRPVTVLPASGLTAGMESIAELTRSRHRPAPAVKLKPFDYLDPRAHWDDSAAAERKGDGLVFDPRPGVTVHGYAQGAYLRSDVVSQTEIRGQQLAAGDDLIHGSGNLVGLSAGQFLTVGEHGLAPWARGEFLITDVTHTAAVPEAFASAEEAEEPHASSFTLIPEKVAFRPAPVPRPTALEDWALVLSAFEQDPIDTDRHGRVRVHFLYDRREEVTADQRSCWVPVTQWWAGSGYGSQIIPRAGMLARIEYLFGDPDRPVVAECFPTGANRVPAALPALKSRLTLRSRSLREGGRDTVHFNEVALDDAAEKEELFLRAGRNLRRKVLHDDRTETVHDETHLVGGDQGLEVIGNRTKAVASGETETVLANRATTIEADDEQTVALGAEGGGKDVDTVDGESELHVILSRTTSIEGLEKGDFREGREREVGPDDLTKVTKLRAVRADEEWKAAQGKSSLVLKEGNATGHADGEVEAATENAQFLLHPKGPARLTIKNLKIACGASQIVMGSRSIVVKSPEVLVRGAQGTIKLDPSGAKTSGQNVTASAVVLNELKGPLVMISDTPGAVDPLVPQHQHLAVPADLAEQLRLQDPDEELLDLEVTLLGHDLLPAAHIDYKLMIPTGEVFSGKTDGSGQLKQKLPGSAKTALLTYEPAEGAGLMCRSLALMEEGDAASVELLRHLGHGGPTSPAEEVVREFQATANLDETGQLDPDTKKAIAALRAGKGK